MKKNIVFLAPQGKGGTYFYYKKIVDYLKEYEGECIDVRFCNSLWDYVKLHFQRVDVIFSIIPFFFKPLRAKKYIFNLHGNYQIEKKNRGLGVKLLYLAPWNLWFADAIMLTSYYLADKLGFRDKYDDKIVIVPNVVDRVSIKNTQCAEYKYNFLTITSFTFYSKGKGVVKLGNVIKQIGENNPAQKITFTIVGNDESTNCERVKEEFNTIEFPSNVCVRWKGWLDKKDLVQEFLQHNTFLYRSELDNTPGVILEAMSYNLRICVNDFESFSYFLPHEVICVDEEAMVKKIEQDQKMHIKVQHLNNVVTNIVDLL